MTDAERSYMAELANHLGELFPNHSTAELMAQEAGLDSGLIQYEAIPVDYWRRILQSAVKNSKGLTPVIQVALSRYPNNNELVRLFTQMPTPDPGAMTAGIERLSQQMAEMQAEQKAQSRRLTALSTQVSGLSQQVSGLSQSVFATQGA